MPSGRRPYQMLALLLFVGCGPGADSTPPDDSVGPPSPPAAVDETVREPRDDDWFEEVPATRTGVVHTYRSGRTDERLTIVESVGGGATLLDVDRDGDLDLFLPGGGAFTGRPLRVEGRAPKLFRNDGDLRFTDITADAGLAQPTDYSHAGIAADYDGDGWTDLFVTCLGRSRLFRNEQGTFRDVTDESGLHVDGWATAAAWGDFDGDGRLDLYVCRYLDWTPSDDTPCGPRDTLEDVCEPQRFEPAADLLFRGRSDGTFEDVSEAAGILPGGMGLGVVATDLDRDGHLDLYVANDVVANRLYRGGAGLAFTEVGGTTGAAFNEFGAPEGSMGIDAGDVDGDGRADLVVTNFQLEDNSLYLERDGLYAHSSVAMGLGGSSRINVGFGTGLVDLDLDGRLDLFVLNGHVLYHSPLAPLRQRPLLYRNLDGRRFEEVRENAAPFFERPGVWRGAAVGDLDDDGGLDLVVVGQDESTTILRNRHPAESWIHLQLVGTASPRDPIGARVLSEYGGRTLVRWVRSGAGYLSTFDPRILLPAAGDAPIDVTVEWPSGRTQKFSGLQPRATHRLTESAE